MKAAAKEVTPSNWSDDVMHRKPYADFLTTYIEDRVSKSGDSLTITLDAKWGTGKTFFVQRWVKDLVQNGRGAIVFDAWTNDFSPEPLKSFMAELGEGMKLFHAQLPATTRASKSIKEKTSSLVKVFQKTALPATGLIATSIIKKATGVAVDELWEAGSLDGALDQDWGDLTKGVSESLEKGLGALFQKSLEEHQARAKAAGTFKKTLQELVKLLQEAEVIKGPLYIFIDELDRCRPDYSIKLLEGIKHLFAVPGVVFVVSTNLEQLSKSVQGVYGAGFNGQRYLKRFFDFEFTLPAPDNYSFAASLQGQLPIADENRIEDGLHPETYKGDNRVARAFERIATACNLELRDQKQVWVVAQAAASGIPPKAKVYIIWIFFLAALKHSSPDTFEKLTSAKKFSSTLLTEAFSTIAGWEDVELLSITYTSTDDFHPPRAKASTASLMAVLQQYFQSTYQSIAQISQFHTNRRSESYPETLTEKMIGERENSFASGQATIPAITDYSRLVTLAGLIG